MSYLYTLYRAASRTLLSAFVLAVANTKLNAAAPDKQAPTVPTGLVATSITTSGFSISWVASTDNISVTGYEVFLGGVSQGTVTTTSKALSGLAPGTNYSVTIRAGDAAGNWSTQSQSLPVTTATAGGDSTAPSVPTNLLSSGISSTGFTVTWTASTDNVGVTGYEVFLNGTSQGTVTTNAKTFTGLAAATNYSVTVRARDAAANWSAQSASLPVTTNSNSTSASSVAAGMHHFLLLKGDGKVWAWGFNANGELGDGTTIDRYTPVQVSSLSSVVQADAGQEHGIALRSDGSVWTWGGGGLGQIGNGKTNNQIVPVSVTALSGIKAIAAGQVSNYAVQSDGSVWSWGYNYDGELGIGNTTNQTRPVKITGITGIKAISGGNTFAMALDTSGAVWSWGANSSGQLGIGTTQQKLTPVRVPGLPTIVAIRAMAMTSLALDAQGRVWSWGNYFGAQTDSQSYRLSPDVLAGLPAVTSLCGGSTSETPAVIATTGDVYLWGRNDYGQVQPPGGVSTYIFTPRVFPALAGSTAVATGSPSVAIRNDGTVRTWGDFNGAASPRIGCSAAPIGVAPVILNIKAGFVRLALGEDYVVAIDTSAKVWTFGANAYGQLGIGNTQSLLTFSQIPALSGIQDVKANNGAAAALDADGKLWMWGRNVARFGDGSTIDRGAPASVAGAPITKTFDLGDYHVLAVTNAGEVWGWGNNNYGQLGFPMVDPFVIAVPTKVPGISSATAVAAGMSHSLALLSNGTVMSWGWLNNVYNITPTAVSGLSGATKIAAGNQFSLALLSNGTVSGWGLNTAGQLGNGSTTYASRPTAVSGLTGIVDISAHENIAVALRNDGTVWGWGNNNSIPTRLGSITGAVAVSASTYISQTRGLIGSDRRIWVQGRYVPQNAVVVNNLLHQVADFRVIASPVDDDSDGIPDTWETANFGTLANTAGADTEGDGLSNVEEYLLGSDPNLIDTDGDSIPDWLDPYPLDPYNNVRPTLTIIGGNAQQAVPGAFVPSPLDVAVWSADGASPLVNAPVTFTVTSGGGLLAIDRSGSSQAVNSLNLLTDTDGTAQVFYQQPSTDGVVSSIRAQAGLTQVTFSSTSAAPQVDSDGDGLSDDREALLGTNPNNPDTDGDGMPDGWEVTNGLNPLVNDANGDADGDGIKNIDEYRWNINPQSSELNIPSSLTRFEYNLKDELARYTPVLGGAVTFTPDKEGNLQSIY